MIGIGIAILCVQVIILVLSIKTARSVYILAGNHTDQIEKYVKAAVEEWKEEQNINPLDRCNFP